jgi:hypothetical protein
MPIAPCFDPTTGASGGSQGGGGSTGADLSALGFEAVDLTDGWTLYDPSSLVNSVSHSGGINTVTMNALGAGSNDYAFTVGGNLKMPRWYKNLSALDASGGEVRLNTGDTYSLHTITQFVEPVDRFGTEIVMASSPDPTGVTQTACDLCGGILKYPASGNPQGGAFGVNNSALGTASASLHQTLVVTSFAAGRMNTPTYINVDSSGGFLTSGQRATNQDYANTSTDLSVVVGLGTAGSTTITAGEDAKIKVFFRVIKFSTP